MVAVRLKFAIRLVIGLLLATVLFVAINLHQPDPGCDDCFASHGRPFPYYHEGGFGGGAGYAWPGIVADASIVILLAFLIAAGLNRILTRKRNQ